MTTMEGITTGTSTDTDTATTTTTGIGTAEEGTGVEESGFPFSPTRITLVTTAIRTTATAKAIIPATTATAEAIIRATVIKRNAPGEVLHSHCAGARDSAPVRSNRPLVVRGISRMAI